MVQATGDHAVAIELRRRTKQAQLNANAIEVDARHSCASILRNCYRQAQHGKSECLVVNYEYRIMKREKEVVRMIHERVKELLAEHGLLVKHSAMSEYAFKVNWEPLEGEEHV